MLKALTPSAYVIKFNDWRRLPILRAEIAFVSAAPWGVWIVPIAIHSPHDAVA